MEPTENAEEAVENARLNGNPEGEQAAGEPKVDHRPLPSSDMRSYALLTPELKDAYFQFYKKTYTKSVLDIKTKEMIAVGAALVSGCKGCLEGHMKKSKKVGVTAEELAEVIAVALGVAAATIVDRSDIANFNLGGLYDKPE
ncbi:MAG: carboxymuconolactone decarboxylase family protein [Planctomycetota bacterium]|jgi:AhpD family alkylhydroperoxidase